MRLILASASPQRRRLMAEAGYRFDVVPSDAPEIASGLEPDVIALLNAEAKARAVAAAAVGDPIVIGADTVVDVGGQPLGQPEDEEQAAGHLRALSGQLHEVHTGVCVVSGESERSGIASTRVAFRTLSPADIASYVASEEWQGRAGGYAIQESGDAFVERIEGDFDNVVGLPLRLVSELLPESVQPV